MKRGSLFSLVIVALLLSCGNQKKYVESEMLAIEYWGEIAEGEWIEIDGLRLYHAMNDTTITGCSPDYSHLYTDVNTGNSDSLFLPSTEFYRCISNGRFSVGKIGKAELAFNLISAINDFSPLAMGSLELPYKNLNNTLLTTYGKLKLVRTDGKEIRVSTSEGYKAEVKVVKEEDAK